MPTKPMIWTIDTLPS